MRKLILQDNAGGQEGSRHLLTLLTVLCQLARFESMCNGQGDSELFMSGMTDLPESPGQVGTRQSRIKHYEVLSGEITKTELTVQVKKPLLMWQIGSAKVRVESNKQGIIFYVKEQNPTPCTFHSQMEMHTGSFQGTTQRQCPQVDNSLFHGLGERRMGVGERQAQRRLHLPTSEAISLSGAAGTARHTAQALVAGRLGGGSGSPSQSLGGAGLSTSNECYSPNGRVRMRRRTPAGKGRMQL